MVQHVRGEEVDFLFEEIQFDLKEISTLIGCSVDDVYMVMHLIFNRMRTTQVCFFCLTDSQRHVCT